MLTKPVPDDSFRKAGILAYKAGDFRRFPPRYLQTGGSETKWHARKAGIPAHSRVSGKPGERRNGRLGREDSNFDMGLESDALACLRGAAEHLFVKIHKSLGTLLFREPYRMCGVQSFGEKWVFRRIMSAPCREEIRSANEKSLPLLGLIAHKLTRRTYGFGRGGGESVLSTVLILQPNFGPSE